MTRSFSGMMPLSVMWMCSGQTSVQHLVMLHRPMLSVSLSRARRFSVSRGCISRLATRLAVDLGRAGAALARLAVPAAGQVGRLGRLDLVDAVEHHHALADVDGVFLEVAAVVVAAPDAKSGLRHGISSPPLAA